MQSWIVVLTASVACLFLGFGCASQSENPRTDRQESAAIPTPPPAQPATPAPLPAVATTPPVYVPDMTHANDPIPAGVLNWDYLMQSVEAAADQAQVQFTFNFTNMATAVQTSLATNVTTITNFTTVTNSSFWGKKIARVAIASNTNIVTVTDSITPVPVTVLSIHPSCGCTTAQLPPMPWRVDSGTKGQIGLTVNLAGKTGTLFKTVKIVTDRGYLTLSLRITILPPVIPLMTDADRARALEAAKVDRQAVFKGDCATCHVKPGEGKYGKALYDASCAICHESEHRASMVADLHNLKTPTNEDFWRTWIMHGKPGSLMPAFSTAEGGPLNDLQIASLAAYLHAAIPSKVPPPPQ